jgi:hypothetical protein
VLGGALGFDEEKQEPSLPSARLANSTDPGMLKQTCLRLCPVSVLQKTARNGFVHLDDLQFRLQAHLPGSKKPYWLHNEAQPKRAMGTNLQLSWYPKARDEDTLTGIVVTPSLLNPVRQIMSRITTASYFVRTIVTASHTPVKTKSHVDKFFSRANRAISGATQQEEEEGVGVDEGVDEAANKLLLNRNREARKVVEPQLEMMRAMLKSFTAELLVSVKGEEQQVADMDGFPDLKMQKLTRELKFVDLLFATIQVCMDVCTEPAEEAGQGLLGKAMSWMGKGDKGAIDKSTEVGEQPKPFKSVVEMLRVLLIDAPSFIPLLYKALTCSIMDCSRNELYLAERQVRDMNQTMQKCNMVLVKGATAAKGSTASAEDGGTVKDRIVTHLGRNIGAWSCLMHLISDHKNLLDESLDNGLIPTFIELIANQGPTADYLQFLRSLTLCRNTAVKRAQEDLLVRVYSCGNPPANLTASRHVESRRRLTIETALDTSAGRTYDWKISGVRVKPAASSPRTLDIVDRTCLGNMLLTQDSVHDLVVSWWSDDHWRVGMDELYHSARGIGLEECEEVTTPAELRAYLDNCQEAARKCQWVALKDIAWTLEFDEHEFAETYNSETHREEKGATHSWHPTAPVNAKVKNIQCQRALALYYQQLISLYASICHDRSYNCITAISKQFSYELCITALVSAQPLDPYIPDHPRIPLNLATSFCKLLLSLWLDRFPHEKIEVPKQIFIYSDLDEVVVQKKPKFTVGIPTSERDYVYTLTSNGRSMMPQFQLVGEQANGGNEEFFIIGDSDKFMLVQSIITRWFEGLDGAQAIDEKHANRLSLQMLTAVDMLTRCGFYGTVQEVWEVCVPLMSILDGRVDVFTSQKIECAAPKLKPADDGGRSARLQTNPMHAHRSRSRGMSASSRKHSAPEHGVELTSMVDAGAVKSIDPKSRYVTTSDSVVLVQGKIRICKALKAFAGSRTNFRVQQILAEIRKSTEAGLQLWIDVGAPEEKSSSHGQAAVVKREHGQTLVQQRVELLLDTFGCRAIIAAAIVFAVFVGLSDEFDLLPSSTPTDGGDSDRMSFVTGMVETAIALFFVAEVSARFYALGVNRFCRDICCHIDLAVTVIDVLGLVSHILTTQITSYSNAGRSLRMLRALRIGRVFRLCRVGGGNAASSENEDNALTPAGIKALEGLFTGNSGGVLNFGGMCKTSLSAMLLDLLMYDDDELFENVFGLLSVRLLETNALLTSLGEVEVLHDKLDVQRYEAARSSLVRLQERLGAFEVWGASDDSAVMRAGYAQTNAAVLKLCELCCAVGGDNAGSGSSVGGASFSVTGTSEEQALEHAVPNPYLQVIMRKLHAHEIALMSYKVQSQKPGAQADLLHTRHLCNRFLCLFVRNNVVNQRAIFPSLQGLLEQLVREGSGSMPGLASLLCHTLEDNNPLVDSLIAKGWLEYVGTQIWELLQQHNFEGVGLFNVLEMVMLTASDEDAAQLQVLNLLLSGSASQSGENINAMPLHAPLLSMVGAGDQGGGDIGRTGSSRERSYTNTKKEAEPQDAAKQEAAKQQAWHGLLTGDAATWVELLIQLEAQAKPLADPAAALMYHLRVVDSLTLSCKGVATACEIKCQQLIPLKTCIDVLLSKRIGYRIKISYAKYLAEVFFASEMAFGMSEVESPLRKFFTAGLDEIEKFAREKSIPSFEAEKKPANMLFRVERGRATSANTPPARTPAEYQKNQEKYVFEGILICFGCFDFTHLRLLLSHASIKRLQTLVNSLESVSLEPSYSNAVEFASVMLEGGETMLHAPEPTTEAALISASNRSTEAGAEVVAGVGDAEGALH